MPGLLGRLFDDVVENQQHGGQVLLGLRVIRAHVHGRTEEFGRILGPTRGQHRAAAVEARLERIAERKGDREQSRAGLVAALTAMRAGHVDGNRVIVCESFELRDPRRGLRVAGVEIGRLACIRKRRLDIEVPVRRVRQIEQRVSCGLAPGLAAGFESVASELALPLGERCSAHETPDLGIIGDRMLCLLEIEVRLVHRPGLHERHARAQKDRAIRGISVERAIVSFERLGRLVLGEQCVALGGQLLRTRVLGHRSSSLELHVVAELGLVTGAPVDAHATDVEAGAELGIEAAT